MMYYRISFMTWRNYANKLFRESQHKEKMEKKRVKMEAQGRSFIPYMFEDNKNRVQHIIIEIEEELLLTSEEEPENDNQSLIAI
jgi:hypothetical protein